MIGFCLTPLPSSGLLFVRSPSSPASRYFLKPCLYPPSPSIHRIKPTNHTVLCRAEFSPDAPIAAAIGGCVLASLLFPPIEKTQEEGNESGSAIDSGDTRVAVMGIISVIPYFNWLSWVFAWLDTGNRRYAVYATAYLIPYLVHNLSLSPEESWLPIASIILCIIHVQLETSIRNGDLESFRIFNDAAKHLSSASRQDDSQSTGHSKMRREKMNLPPYDAELREENRQLKAKRRSEHHGELKGGWDKLDDDGEEKREH